MKNRWKKTMAFALSLALARGIMPVSIGNYFPTEDAVTVASAADDSKSVQFLRSGTADDNVTVYNSLADGHSMNGVVFTNGVMFNNAYGDSQVTYDVGDVDKLTFSIGHVDNTDDNNAVLRFYLDDVEYDAVDLYWTMDLQEYELDVSKASTLKIVLDRDGWSSYALGNVSVDGEAVSPASVPKYDSTDNFVKSGFEYSNMTIPTSSSKEPTYYMNGRGFYDGIVFDNTYYNSQVCYNVENVKTLNFTIGHVDNSDNKNAVLRFYLDGKEYDSVDLYWTMDLQEYELDVSDASVLRIVLDRNSNYSSYALGDFRVDEFEQSKDHTVPTYDSTEKFVKSGFEYSNMTIPTSSSKEPKYYMNGRGFYDGIVFDNTYYNSQVCYNVENVKTLNFTIGHVDNSDDKNAVLRFYLDGKEYDTVDLYWTMDLQEYELDVSDASVLRIVLDRNSNYSSYALGDFRVDEFEQSKDHTVPTYDSTEKFVKSGFEYSNMTIPTSSSKEPKYYMNGRGFYDGIVFDNTYYNSQVCYNVENVKTLNFTIGHVDNSDNKNAVLRFYLDGKEYDSVDLHWTMNLREYELDVSDASVLRIVLDRDGWSSYALGDFRVDEFEQSKDHTVPTYDSTEKFVKSGFEEGNDIAIHTSSTKDPAYYMNGTGFYDGIAFNNAYGDSRICYNVENVDSLSFTIGHVDDTDGKNATLRFYLDDKEADSVSLTSDMESISYSLDLSNASVLRIVLDRDGWSSYALADPVAVFSDEDTQQSTTEGTKPPTTNPSGDVLYGDANLDGDVTIADAVAILQYLANSDEYALSEEAMGNADCCNVGDGINTDDALAIQKLDAKVIESLPAK